jgi:hypothetical protein
LTEKVAVPLNTAWGAGEVMLPVGGTSFWTATHVE